MNILHLDSSILGDASKKGAIMPYAAPRPADFPVQG